MLISLSIMFSLGRFILYFINKDQSFNSYSIVDIFHIIVRGFEYDVYLVLYLNSLFIILFLLPLRIYNSGFYQFLLKAVFLLVNSLAILINFIDVYIYKNFYHRLRIPGAKQDFEAFLSILDKANFKIFISEYLNVLIFFLVFVFIISLFLRYIKRHYQDEKTPRILLNISSLLYVVSLSVMSYLFVIGNQTYSLKNFYLKSDRRLVPVLVNNPYLLLVSFIHNEPKVDVDNDWNIEDYQAKKQYSVVQNTSNYKNIKFIVVANDIFDNKNYYYKNLHTINNQYDNIFQLLDELLFSYPSVFRKGLYSSFYSMNDIESLVDIIHSIGYYTKLTTFGYSDKEHKLISNFYSFNNFKKNDSSRYFELILIKDKQKFDSINNNYLQHLPKNENELIMGILYNDVPNNMPNKQLPESIKLLSTNNLKFYTSTDSLITQYLDIKPSILNLLGYSEQFIAYGNSLFTKGKKYSYQTISDTSFYVVSDSLLLNFSNNQTTSLHKLENFTLSDYDYKDSLAVESVVLENKLQSMYFDFKNRLINNKLGR